MESPITRSLNVFEQQPVSIHSNYTLFHQHKLVKHYLEHLPLYPMDPLLGKCSYLHLPLDGWDNLTSEKHVQSGINKWINHVVDTIKY